MLKCVRVLFGRNAYKEEARWGGITRRPNDRRRRIINGCYVTDVMIYTCEPGLCMCVCVCFVLAPFNRIFEKRWWTRPGRYTCTCIRRGVLWMISSEWRAGVSITHRRGSCGRTKCLGIFFSYNTYKGIFLLLTQWSAERHDCCRAQWAICVTFSRPLRPQELRLSDDRETCEFDGYGSHVASRKNKFRRNCEKCLRT